MSTKMSTVMNAMELPNVRRPDERGGKFSEMFRVDNVIAKVIWELASKNPLWIFKAKEYQSSTNDQNVDVCTSISFVVHQGAEILGVIGREYMHNKGYVCKVSNERIDKSMSRGSAYRTDCPIKAIAKVTKMFKPNSVNEVVEKAIKEANSIVFHECQAKSRVKDQHNQKLQQGALDYVLKGGGYGAFIAYIHTLEISKSREALSNIAMLEVAKAELNTIEGIKDAMGTSKTALIIVDEGKYVVKIGADVQLYDDTTLPVDLRGKLGMLKLVNPKQFITDMGCRVNDEIFVVKLDEPNIVSQGEE